ncbi:flagellar protein export ATPase FliI [Alkalilimnicola sp. S0819]|uniref:flagellar protein export ATPase FliI n=1 Tax=Alkalilimnicola sp. S0819 TaxID=2613922 RepID=UPI0012614279|nr:flagellar protein export ATPase FliI [Alkalilimnicola sp. S0819]KAB7627179.1 flagellar protein export ATPase FliI [Alkalilimnicola sp. S0819]MPQ15891.1 flagellar protein export ATPase FliI [Alkalilimnicola sp. S0819]
MSVERPRAAHWAARLAHRRESLSLPKLQVEGVLRRMVGLTLEAEGCQAPIGSRCRVEGLDGQGLEAEVVGFAGERLYLMPTGDLHGLTPNARVVPEGGGALARVGDALLGRVLDGAGKPLDGLPEPEADAEVPLVGRRLNPLDRAPIREPLDVGVCAINALLTVGRGQRMGLFAGTGVGKSVLLGMMTRYTNADVVVVGLIGERGREVKEFIEEILGEEGRRRAVVVAAPADESPLMRLHGAALATSIAEHFRDQGKQVLLLMDSLTRYAQAQREIGLAIGEPPTTKGYPPSVFARLPKLVERAGNGPAGGGSITAFYTVLTEGDDQNDPVADAARGILDGHLVLSRELADAGHYPAIDIERSVSRALLRITNEQQRQAIQRFKRLYGAYRQNQDLINVGAYQRGSDPRVDEAIEYYPRLNQFLQQDVNEKVPFEQSVQSLEQLL